MKSSYMQDHFDTIYLQRKKFDEDIQEYRNKEWMRPQPDKWSIGETYYHLYLLLNRFRQLNKFYIPVGKPFSKACRRTPYKTEIEDIYKAYREKHGKPMKAPSILLPPKNIERKIQFKQLKQDLHNETFQFKRVVSGIESNIAGNIRYPDPLAHYPNLIQSIHLIGIHEQHHFRLCRKYYKLNY
ncbi:DinB family protein [Terribacillus sp. AE2B 122]|uniref:DinB family protein n=1 Tax=Terribacillus sp. AE2B 122 TaxID=1331902 RepID=UPI0020C636AF|nr:DinB family protein [Terribacillus sp. AE2B 122]